MGTFCGSPFFVRAGWPVLFFSLVGQTRQGAAAGAFVPHGCGERNAARCRGEARVPTGWGAGGGYHPPGGAAARAWAFSGESPNERAPGGCGPLAPRGGRRSSLALVGFWVGVSKGRLWVYDLRGIEHRFGTFSLLVPRNQTIGFLEMDQNKLVLFIGSNASSLFQLESNHEYLHTL